MEEFRRQKRGGIGVRAIKIVSTRGKLITARAVAESDEAVITSSDGIVIRQAVSNINRYGRNSMGVKVMNLSSDATLSALAIAANGEDE
jgi:DNA gyrase subunit A